MWPSGRCQVAHFAAFKQPGEGDFFGETALLSDAPRNATMRAANAVEVLQLSKEDFEAGFLKAGAGGLSQKRAAMQQTLGFIQMVSRTAAVWNEAARASPGDSTEPAEPFRSKVVLPP